ncbi:hypothetical protein BU24DRAFT_44463 [Aaosphaeria arxii CBS 175.79]|uniref:U4/U6 snRNA-associated-splicing factor PRP24 n=1 Tax=Aaosphaeria arxii CBS 175.79 TaxID=1450172 RepID=A0A6A5YCV2_9PLEO|nr:uncharacterized protein BU24DRAFT_44463 [Aaosphaeria arxii CBS 175.79]KAF2022421.1 hypothetical protein BU24DRAFT_44463 [Aaosphaeria arxii CBS 175.79]
MDINSLLSPQDSPAAETPPPPSLASPTMQSPSKIRPGMRQMPSRTPSGLREQITSSPQLYHNDRIPTPTHAQPAYHQHQHQSQHQPQPGPALHSPSIAAYTNGRASHSATSTPPLDARPQLNSPHVMTPPPSHTLHRQASTPGMDALADLASMQHIQQTARQQGVAQRPSISLQNIPRSISGTSATDVTMVDSPKVARSLYTKFLDAQNVEMLGHLEKALTENPFDYYSHVSFITILHQGLQNTINESSGSSADPSSYELLHVLREAYKTMDSKYTQGEQLWEYRINDEKILARTIEDRMAVLELCQRATQEEPHSPKLWIMYGDYISHLLVCIWEPNPPEAWSEEDRLVGKEIFTADLLMSTLQSGAEHVKLNIADSNLVWDRYLQLLQDDLERHFSPDKARRVSAIFNERLSQPHATWDNTLSLFSTFNSKYNQSNYEAIMERAVQHNSHIKKTYDHRAEFEFQLLQAIQSKDQTAEHWAMTRYLKWEKKTMGVSSFPLVNALYERATLRFPVDPSLWEDYVEFLIWQNNRTVSLLDVLQRATRHCPWSGSLWSHRILTLEAENKDFNEIESIKHSATETGMLEHTDLEELIKVQMSWCGYLRRKAFDSPNASEDDADIAEVGIRSALELVQEMGIKRYGKDWTGDPQYRLERLHIKFWTQRGSVDEARQVFDTIAKQRFDSYEFWYRWYIWEMVVWSNHATRGKDHAGQQLQTPSLATAVLEQGIKRLSTIDQPEPLLEMYLNHCEQHESVLNVRRAMVEGRRSRRTISIRREKERAAAEEAQQQNLSADSNGKRKREEAAEADAVSIKKSKQSDSEEALTVAPSVETAAQVIGEASSAQPTVQKRDREHSSIIVRKLPKSATQASIRKFFRDAGNVRDIHIKEESDSITATVEFETPEEAEYSLSKEAKGYEGTEISITRGENSTLYVANYPSQADEAFMRKLFEPFGTIIDLRFPSLRYNTNRRFCYIQFINARQAQAATSLHDKEIEGLPLVAQISDPNAKKKRDNPTQEGREIFVRGINYKTKQSEIREALNKFGKVEKLNMPIVKQGANKGQNKGSCWVVFDKKEAADAAVAEMHGKHMWDMDLQVEIAKTKEELKAPPKIRSQLVNDTASPEPRAGTPGKADENSTIAPVAERTIALLGIPDTVNDVRIKTLVDPYGVKRVTYMPKHQGAIIEFEEVASVGKASLVLEGHEIIPGKPIKIGTPAELKQMKAEYKPSTSLAQPKPKGEASSNKFMQPSRVSRPVARGGTFRGRGRPGLGHASARPRAEAAGEAKSNEDFRSMLLGGKKDNTKDTEMKDGA